FVRHGTQMLDNSLVCRESRELRAEFRSHGRQRRPVVEREFRDAGSAEFDIVTLDTPGDRGQIKEDIFAEYIGGFPAAQLESDGGCDLIPGLPGAHDLEHLEGAHTARNAIERARGAGVRIGASQNLAGQSDSIFQDHLVADTAATDVKELLDPKLFDELARDR